MSLTSDPEFLRFLYDRYHDRVAHLESYDLKNTTGALAIVVGVVIVSLRLETGGGGSQEHPLTTALYNPTSFIALLGILLYASGFSIWMRIRSLYTIARLVTIEVKLELAGTNLSYWTGSRKRAWGYILTTPWPWLLSAFVAGTFLTRPGAAWTLVIIIVVLGTAMVRWLLGAVNEIQSRSSLTSKGFRRSKFVNFDTGEVIIPPMMLVKQTEKPWDLWDMIDIFECRVEVWQLGVAVQILKEMESQNRLPIWSHAAYGLISVIFSYFEMIGKTLNPKSNAWKSSSVDFNYGFCDVYPQYKPAGDDYSDPHVPDVREFRNRIRNGMYHLAYTKTGLWIHHNNAISAIDFDKKLPDELPEELGLSGADPVYLMDPHLVTRTILDHFPGFLARLRHPDSGDLRAKFKEFFKDFHKE